MKILQINTSVNTGSTGRIAEEIGKLLIAEGHQSYIAYGRKANQSTSELLKIGNKADIFLHVLKSRIFDRHGYGSASATKMLVNQIGRIKPDLIHLHNIHGYYLNIGVLFDYIKKSNMPVIWTFHDCWPFTGHCSYFDSVNCYKWQLECNKCPNIKGYPASWFLDNSRNNYYRKKSIFTNIDNLTIVTPSKWLAKHIEKSFLKTFRTKVIYNGVDLKVFKPLEHSVIYKKYKISKGNFILGVANTWDQRKGLSDFIKLRELIPAGINIVLVGLKPDQIAKLQNGIIGITRIENINEMAMFYSAATAFVNPTYVDNFPTTNIEALACGTPVITYNTGGSPEAVNESTGIIIDKGDLSGLSEAIKTVLHNSKQFYLSACSERAEQFFNNVERFDDYITLYRTSLNKN
jgi:putative colanic acid biosynthesis glycosyltransferase